MPDISLLQREYEVAQEESRIPGILFTVSIIFFIIFVGAYIGLYFYDSFISDEISTVNQDIAKTKIGESSKNIDQLNSLKTKVNTLKTLRESHTSVSKTLSKIEQTTHPDMVFSLGSFDLANGIAKLSGAVSNSAVLLRQVEIYSANKNISDFTLDNPSYAEEHSVVVNINLTLNK